MNQHLLKTPFHEWHASHGARLVDFAGWSMPVQYSSIVAEHQATRTAAGIFDVSHMGRFRFDGEAAADFLDRLLTRRVTGLRSGQVRYSLITNQQGGILDDVLVYCLEESDGEPFHWLVVNAGNREKIARWMRRHLDEAAHVHFTDRTEQTVMIALQGPRALDIAASWIEVDDLGYYTGRVCTIDGARAIVSRTGYTGEDGYEIIVAADDGPRVWEKLMAQGQPMGLTACGLGARDTLRLEAAMPLYGQELSEDINPFQAGLGFAVNLKNRRFVGREALVAAKSKTNPLRVGLSMDGRRAARPRYAILDGSRRVGEITSGTFSPTLNRPIAMGYVDAEYAETGQDLTVDVRGHAESARVVELPFYRRKR
jgi:aminomethyltransferase